MICKPIHYAFFFLLCPLLVAQQAAQSGLPNEAAPQLEKRYLTLPGDTNIELLPPGSAKFASGKTGAGVEFAVDKDVVLSGETLIHAGVPVAGVVERVQRRSRFKHQAAEMDIRVTEMVSGKPTELHLRCFEPEDSSDSDYAQRDSGQGFSPMRWGVIFGVGFVIFLAILAAFNGDR